jgi:formylglycine-generating enzyme required for sulfatase activity
VAVRRPLTAGVLTLGAAIALVAFACTSFDTEETPTPPDGTAGDAGPPDATSVDALDPTDAADAAPGDAGPDAACKGGKDGRPVVRTGAHCMDVKEVSNGDFAKFMATMPPTPPADAGACANNQVRPEPACGTVGRSDQPRTCVDWCDARAYCVWAGKRLCGEAAGGPLLPPDLSTLHDEWFVACAGADGGRSYPYGTAYNVDTCVTEQNATSDVGSRPACRTPEGVLDLSGNASEWLDSCASEGLGADCYFHDGDYARAGQATCAATKPLARTSSTAQLGFRCCSD